MPDGMGRIIMLLTIIVALLIFSVLIIAHEFGHFITARKSGVIVEEFAVGMGPVLYKRQGKKSLFTIRAFPIGGFCRMKGEDGEDYEEGSFNSASAWKRILILAAGSLMNFVVAILLFCTIYMMVGTYTNTIGSLAEISPARDAGIQVGDTILQIDGNEINDWEDVLSYIRGGTGEKITLQIEKSDGAVETYDVTPYYEETEDVYLIGISPEIKRNIFVSFGRAVGLLGTYIKLILGVFVGLFRGEFGIDAFTGPIGATAVIGEYLSQGLVYLFSIAASISVSLGLFNLFPIPALDGSRIVFVVVEKIKGSSINRETEGKIHFIGFVVLILFAILIAYRDVINYF